MKKDIHGGDIWKAARQSGVAPDRIIDFSASINPLGLPAASMKAIENSLKLIPPYPEPSPVSFKEAIASYHGISPEEVLPANGSTELIYLIPRLFAGKALVIEPAFSEYRKALAPSGIKAESLVLKEQEGFVLDPCRVDSKLKGHSLLYIANPANPTGVLTDTAVINEIIRIAKRRGATVVLDEAFADFAGTSNIPEAVRAGNVIVLRSMTKFYAMAGLRLGYAVGGKRIISKLSKLVPPWSVNTLASAAGVAALNDRPFHKDTFEWLGRERDFLYSALASVKGLKPYAASANYMLVKVLSSGTDALRLRAMLMKEGILIRELSAFRGLGPRFFRVAVLGRRENKRLVSSLKDVFGEKRTAARKRTAVSAAD